MAFEALIIHNDEEGPWTELKRRYEVVQRGQYVVYNDKIFFVSTNPTLYFIEVDPFTPDRHDPQGRWGKYQYLGDPDERNH